MTERYIERPLTSPPSKHIVELISYTPLNLDCTFDLLWPVKDKMELVSSGVRKEPGWVFMVPFLIPRQLHWPVFQRNNLKQSHNGMTARPKIKSVVFKTISV